MSVSRSLFRKALLRHAIFDAITLARAFFFFSFVYVVALSMHIMAPVLKCSSLPK